MIPQNSLPPNTSTPHHLTWPPAPGLRDGLIDEECGDGRVADLVGKTKNGFDHWFTAVTEPGVELTNNRAERALREHVVQRKIIGTLRNEKGMRIHETIMTLLATWKQKGLDPYEEMRKTIRS